MMKKNLRSHKFIEPRIQRRFAFLFLSTAGTAALLQTIVLAYTLSSLAGELPNDGLLLSARIGKFLVTSFFITLGMLTPLTFALGISSTFKIVGPLYRFRVFLDQIRRGERPGPCRIRKDDELQDFCELLNEAMTTLHGENEGADDSLGSDQAKAA